ncbi:probable 2-oxoglutarate-dependent dioxygenase AOP1 [Gastrolobium bilobum]|uniref:probable 2-oxoglutarate-dependent dioxygenase AOP1 n=1 Tax=Gastrolobium bilobum TaxID=150636 RepID=UPI002AB07303|nr:probable 2-oxoglutarate-dependent dioxygenase AOP1 [Gastrolobium bilobum]
MGSETPLKLPVIDVTNLSVEVNGPKWEAVKSQVYEAVVEYGCFEAIYDKVPADLLKAMFAAIKELFDLPLQTKQLNVSEKPYHGYFGQHPMVPLFERMTIEDANVYEKVDSMTNTWWPKGNPSFSKTIQAYSEQLSELDQIIRRMILESMGVEKYLEEHMNTSNYVLRVVKYECPQNNDTEVGLSEHTDRNIMTILYQNEVEGLEVMTKDGKWISYKPSPNSFVVMIGDSLHAWSNGRVYPPFHRVMMSGNKARYSVGLFYTPKGGNLVKAPEELVDEEHPLLFKPFDFVEFFNYLYSEKCQGDQSPLHTFCGV